MFADFLKRLTAPTPAPLSDPDARLALGALMVRIARADHDYAASEAALIDATLQDRFALSPGEAAQLRADAEQLEAEAPDTVRFTRAIKEAVPHEARLELVQALWQLVLADGRRSDEENAQLRLISNLLGLTDTQSAAARHRAEAAGG